MVSAEDDSSSSTGKPIRDKAFAKRLSDAVADHPEAPSGHGRQMWLRNRVKDRFSVNFSPEALRKWFAGETRPRPKTMSLIAQALDVDEGWLSLGLKPGDMPAEKRKRNASADGAVNFLAGLIQMSGGTIAFTEHRGADDVQGDLYAIINGRQYTFEAKRATPDVRGEMHFNLPPRTDNLVVVGVVDTSDPTKFDIIRLPTEVIKTQGRRKGGFVELPVVRQGETYRAGEAELPKVLSLADLLEKPASKGSHVLDEARRALDLDHA